MLAGGLSPYGTMGQGGNAYEWDETDLDLVNDSSSSFRGLRGGDWTGPSGNLHPTHRGGGLPSEGFYGEGFRVASIPEPSTGLLGTFGTIWLLRRVLRVRYVFTGYPR